jgi:glycosyltransferase 2 family protein
MPRDSSVTRPVSSSAAPARARLLLAVKFGVSVGLLVLLFRQTNFSAVSAHLRDFDPRWLVAALALLAVMVTLSAWRWRLLLKTQEVACSLRHLVGSFLVATFFNNFLPSNIGGDVIRIADTAPLARSRTLAAGVVLLDRGLGLLALVLVAAAGGVLLRNIATPGDDSPYLWIAFALAVAAALPTLFAPGLLARALSPLRWLGHGWVDQRIDVLTGMLLRFGQSRPAVVAAFAAAVGVQLMLVAFYLAVARALGIPLSTLGALLVVPVSLAVQMVPLSINGFGVREAVFAYYFRRLGLTVDAALALSLVATATLALFSTSGGVAFLLRRRRLSPPLPAEA